MGLHGPRHGQCMVLVWYSRPEGIRWRARRHAHIVRAQHLRRLRATPQNTHVACIAIEAPQNVNDHKNKFNFVVVTDRTGGERKGIWEKGIEKINLMQPAFVVSVGDLINGYTEDLNKIENEWNEFNSFVKKLASLVNWLVRSNETQIL